MSRLLFIVALLVAAWATPAAAYMPSWHSCRNFFGNEADLPAKAKPYFDGGEMVTVCQNFARDGQTYLVASKPLRGLRGVCQVALNVIDPDKDTPDSQWVSDNYHGVLMLKADTGDCPRPDDKRYIQTAYVPESLFLLAMDLLHRIQSGAPVEDIFTPANLDPKQPRQLTGWNNEVMTDASWIDKAKEGRLLIVSSLRISWLPVPPLMIDIAIDGHRWGLAADLFDGKLKLIDGGISSRASTSNHLRLFLLASP